MNDDLSFDAKLDNTADLSLLGNPNQNPDYDFTKTSPLPDSGTPSILNSFSGLLSKSADTFLDVFATAGAQKIVGSAYPTGQAAPAAAASKAQTDKKDTATANAQALAPFVPYVIGGIALVAVVVLVVSLKK